ncbi:Ger(x)C family spore germination protein [Paenibacillus filicis]|uniref:Ger(X)C family spore germination protein n=1 Tax=Paenibacillus gyeongsangnamensis TaxID=3388067 RepID=A0ABT4Q3Y9_9BACL|nr:Ger(x)C family spore germination protein [Paenibacillus filicis]MCZ8511546.1 Ger(x)C family spore germination protein [Paenibacillus filicis]
MKPFMLIGLLFIVLITSGCWDHTEINDIAFVMGSAIDLGSDGDIVGSAQIAVPASGLAGPSAGGGQQKKFFVITASGKNITEVIQRLQKKLSRRLFLAHRSTVFIGEQLAKHGIKDVLDNYTHDPRNRLRTNIMVVKGREGRDILQIQYPFEQVPTEAVKEMEFLGIETVVNLRDLFKTALSEGINPVMGVIEPDVVSKGMKQSENNMFRLSGTAVFKNFKLAGFLNEKETGGLLWVTGKMKLGRVTAHLPEGNGNVGMVLTSTKRRITPVIRGNKVKINVQLQGEGSLYENNTSLDVGQLKNLELVQHALEKSVEKQVQDFLSKIQKQYKVDIVGFGQEIYRNQPKQWKALKDQWDTKFPEADISIAVKLSVHGTGMAGPPILLNEKEIKE